MESSDGTITTPKPRSNSQRNVALIIIIILALLAATFFVPVMSRSTRYPIEKVEIKGLELAIKGYHTEYNRFPPLDITDENQFIESKGLLIEILTAKGETGNPRGIAFYDPQSRSTRPKLNGSSEAVDKMNVRDPRGYPYRIYLDWNDDGRIANPKDPSSFISSSVIVYSAGPDGDYNTWQDNFTSWER